MPLALSGGPYIYASTNTGSLSTLLSTYLAALAAAGWVDVGASAAATGRRMRATSTQGLSVDVDLWNSGSAIGIQFDPVNVPSSHVGVLFAPGGATSFIIAHPCQFFIGRLGGGTGQDGQNFCGGIPFIPNVAGGRNPNCGSVGINGDGVTSAWWTNSDYFGSAFHLTALNLRGNGLDIGGSDGNDAYFNGTYCAAGSGPTGGTGTPRVISYSYMDGTVAPVYYPDGAPLIVEPLIVWGLTNPDVPRVRGQLWDSMIVTAPYPADDTTSVFGSHDYEKLNQNYSWFCYTNNCTPGSLYLIKKQMVTLGSDSYTY